MQASNRVVRQAAWIAALGSGYGLSALLSIHLYALGDGVSGLWIANAFAVAMLLRTVPRERAAAYPAIAAAIIVTNLLHGSSLVITGLFAAANLAEIAFALWLSGRLLERPDAPAETVSDQVRVMAAAGLFVPAVVGAVFSIVAGAVLGWPFVSSFSQWFAGDALGYAIAFPVFLLASPAAVRRFSADKMLAKIVVVSLACMAWTAVALLTSRYPFMLIMVACLLAATRMPPLGMAVLGTLVGTVSIVIGSTGVMPGLSNPVENAGSFQLSLAVATVMPYLASLLMEEMRRDRRRIQDSERLFRRAMEDSAVGMALVGPDGRFLEVNRAYADMIGCTVHELMRRTVADITHPDDVAETREVMRRAWAGEISNVTLEKRFLKVDGTEVWARVVASVIFDPCGDKPLYLVGQVEDISAQRMAEARLKEAEARWNVALESAGQGVWHLDAGAGTAYYSPMWKQMLGYKDQELANTPGLWLDLIHPDDRARVLALDKAHLNGRTSMFEAEFRMRHKSGRWVWILDRGKVFERDAEGNPLRATGTHTDITRQKEAEAQLSLAAKALADEKERLRITLHSIADAVICTDAAHRITFMNPVAEQMTGRHVADAYGRPLARVFAPVDEETGAPLAPLSPGVDAAETAPRESRAVLVRPDGTRRSIREVISPIVTAERGYAGMIIVFQDVTDARAMQRDLVHAASHDALTGLMNRSGFMRTLAGLPAEAQATHRHALLFVDLDRFKAVNDTAGHAAGDALLREVAAVLRTAVRAGDTVARFGGDEFAVLLRACPVEQAMEIARALAAAVAGIDFRWEDGRYAIGASIGVAPVGRAGVTVEAMLAEADAACYAAKAAGRGGAVLAGPEPRLDPEPVRLSA